MNRSEVKKVTMNLPSDVIMWLQQKATHRVSSMTTEAIAAIRAVAAQEHRERASKAGVAAD